MNNYNVLFEKEYNTSQEIDNTFAAICNEQGFSKGIEYLKSINFEWLDYDGYVILYTINAITKATTTLEEKKNLLKRVSRQEDVKEIKIEQSDKFNIPQLIILKEDYEIRVMQLSELIPEAMEVLPDLESDERMGTCFAKAYDIALNLGIPNDIVTGYCYGYTDKSKFLHSWVETKYKGEEIVIDGVLNSIINKDGYYKLRHIEPLTRISDQTLNSDIEKYLLSLGTITPEIYYVFRDEIIKDFEKNAEVFQRSLQIK